MFGMKNEPHRKVELVSFRSALRAREVCQPEEKKSFRNIYKIKSKVYMASSITPLRIRNVVKTYHSIVKSVIFRYSLPRIS
jgi:hypothetical protein